MTYFNGGTGGHTFAGEPIPYVATTRIYCDDCAETAIPLPDVGPTTGTRVGRHWETGFKWAPYYGGNAKCLDCGKAV